MKTLAPYQISLLNCVRYPILTEKTISLIEQNQYSFAVSKKASKLAVKSTIETFFNVKVISVNTSHQPRRSRRVGKFIGHRANYKRAIVTLAPGNSINIFDGT
jgi:large subunit ribosomal protein L23